MFAAGKTAVVSGAGPDDKFNYVTMLLHGDGTNGAQNNTFLDSSTNAFSITRTGNTTQGSFSPYGYNWSNYFNASSSYLTAPAASIADFGTGDFIVEAWFNCASTTGNQKIFDNYNGNNNPNPTLLLNIGGAGKVSWYAGQTAVINSSSTFSVGVWNYVVVSRVSSTTKMFLNGTEVGSVSDTRTYAAGYTNVGIGAEANGGGSAFNGYISNLRVVKGSGVTSSTIPTTPSTAITNTVLLTCQSNRFIDNSSNAYTITANGTPSVQRFNPFGTSTAYSTSVIGGSGIFASGNWLDVAANSAFSFTGNFTVECWVYQTSRGNNGVVTEIGLYTDGVMIRLGTIGGIYDAVYVNNVSIGGISTYVPLNSWNHIAVVRSGTSITVYVNGTSRATGTFSGTVNGAVGGTRIGAPLHTAGTDQPFSGYITDFRIVKGTAVYTTTFTPPTAPLTAITNTSLLNVMTNAAIFDNAMMNDLETVGNAQISTSVKKYGSGSIYFDGTGDWLATPARPSLAFGIAPFTLEAWVYPTTLFGTKPILESRSSAGSSAGYAWLVNSSGYLNVYTNGAFLGASSSALTANVWTHVALVRTGTGTNQTTYYINGVASGTITMSGNFTDAITLETKVGGSTSSGEVWVGYMDDLRITNGYARYTGNFTPPTAAFSNTGPT